MRAVGKEQFVAFSLYFVPLTTTSLGLKRFGATAEIIYSQWYGNFVSGCRLNAIEHMPECRQYRPHTHTHCCCKLLCVYGLSDPVFV